MADVRNDPRWHTDVLEAQLTSGTVVAEGTTFTIRFRPFMGMSDAHRFVIEERMGKFEAKIILIIEPNFAGSQITRRV